MGWETNTGTKILVIDELKKFNPNPSSDFPNMKLETVLNAC
jgi:hypothetical protein